MHSPPGAPGGQSARGCAGARPWCRFGRAAAAPEAAGLAASTQCKVTLVLTLPVSEGMHMACDASMHGL